MSAPQLLDIGEYANDSRLVQHAERYATFYGHRCNPSVGVVAVADGFVASQTRSEVRNGEIVMLPPSVTVAGTTAAEALAKIIGPVTP
jgi:hypothetical protein